MMCVAEQEVDMRERMFTSQISKMVKQKQCCQMQLKHRYIRISIIYDKHITIVNDECKK